MSFGAEQIIKATVIEDNIIHVSVVIKGKDGYNYERVYYLDFNKITDTEHMISIEHNDWMIPNKERTKVRLTFEDIPITKLMRWKQDEEEDRL